MIVASPKASITRPANTTAYAAGQVVSDTPGTRFVFTGLRSSATDTSDGAELQSAILADEANVATKPDLELWLFTADPGAMVDQAAFNPSNAVLETLLGVIPFPVATFKVALAGSGAAGNCSCTVTNIWMVAPANTLYGVLVVRNAYVPISAEKIQIMLCAVKVD